MKKIVLFASVCGLGLVAASPPTNGYPPCSATVTDRCIQLYERGVATAANLALNERLGPNNSAMAMGGPFEPVEEYPAAQAQDEYAESWSDHPEDAGTDVLAAEDASYEPYADEQYAGNEWSSEEPAGDWSGFEDHADY